MRKTLLSLTMLAFAAGCDTTTGTPDPVLTGGAAGAVLGAAVRDDDRAEGAIIGAALGAAAGGVVAGAQQPRQCRYTYSDGTSVVRDCPR